MVTPRSSEMACPRRTYPAFNFIGQRFSTNQTSTGGCPVEPANHRCYSNTRTINRSAITDDDSGGSWQDDSHTVHCVINYQLCNDVEGRLLEQCRVLTPLDGHINRAMTVTVLRIGLVNSCWHTTDKLVLGNTRHCMLQPWQRPIFSKLLRKILGQFLILEQSLTISVKTLTRHNCSLPTNSRFNNVT